MSLWFVAFQGSTPIGGPIIGLMDNDAAFERRIGDYLRATQEWAPPDRPEPAERHFIRKKRRAALFEARKKPT